MPALPRRRVLATGLAAGATALAAPHIGTAASPTVLHVAMTLGDIPLTTGQASQGGEGQRFIGMTLYDGLLNWDLSRADAAAKLAPRWR